MADEIMLIEVKRIDSRDRPFVVQIGREQFGQRHFTESLRFTGAHRAARVGALLAEQFSMDGWDVIVIKDGKEKRLNGS